MRREALYRTTNCELDTDAAAADAAAAAAAAADAAAAAADAARNNARVQPVCYTSVPLYHTRMLMWNLAGVLRLPGH